MSELNREQLLGLTNKELDEHADMYYGIPTASIGRKEDKVDMILQLAEKFSATLAEVVPKEDTQEVLQKTGGTGKGPGPGRIRVIIHRSGKDERQRPVFLGHNLRGYLVPRGREVDLPADVVSGCLAMAIEMTNVWDDEVETPMGKGGWVLAERESYPFQIVAFGPDTEEARVRLGYAA